MAQDINNFIDPKLIESINKLNTALIDIGTTIDTISIPAIKKLEDAQKKLGKGTDDNKSKRKSLTTAEKEAAKIVKQLETSEQKLLSLQKGQQDALIKVKTELQKTTKATKDLQRAQQAQKGSTEQLLAVNVILEKRLRNVNQETAKGKKQADLLTSAIDKNNAKIKEQSSALTKQKINVGNYRNSLEGLTVKVKDLTLKQRNLDLSTKKGRAEFKQLNTQINNTKNTLNKYTSVVNKSKTITNNYGTGIKRLATQFAGALGLTSLVFLFINVLKGSFNTIREFTKQNAVLAGVLGKTRKEIKQLTNQAIQLGSVYPVTASEVNKLQVSFARLGFTQAEIISLTEATILGSIALNSSLDATATLVGAVVKAYQSLGTEDASEIIDRLTVATQKSSLSFSGLETALPKVASAASAMNFTLSSTLTHLGIINDATLDASISGTSLRNIYLELAKRGITLNEALELINTSSNKLSTSFELFGKRGAIAGLALANAGEKAIEFEKAVDDAGGTAERVALEQMETLDGAIKGMSSSWEKLILSFKESEGAFSSFFKETSDLFDNWSSEYISKWQKFISTFSGAASRRIAKETKILTTVLSKISNAANETELAELVRQHERMLGENEVFDKNFEQAVNNRYIALEQQEKDSWARSKKAIDDAKVVKFKKAQEASDKLAKAQLKIAKELEADINKIMTDVPTTFEGMLGRMEKILLTRKQTIKQEFAEIFAEFGFDEEDTENFDKEIAAFEKAELTKTGILIENEELKKQVRREAGDAVFGIIQSNLDSQLRQEGLTEKEMAKIQSKKAAFAAAQALFSIGLDTFKSVFAIQAQAAILLANPFTAPLAVLALAQIPKVIAGGAIAGALVLGQAIPQFAKGTNYAPGGVTELAERGREMVINPSGKIWMAENRGLYNLQQGSKVLTNTQTINQELNDKNIVSELVKTRKAIQRMPQQRQESRFDARNRGYREGYLDRKHFINN